MKTEMPPTMRDLEDEYIGRRKMDKVPLERICEMLQDWWDFFEANPEWLKQNCKQDYVGQPVVSHED